MVPLAEQWRQRADELHEEANTVIHVHKEHYKEVGPHSTNALKDMRALAERLSRLEAAFTSALRSTKLR